MTVLHKAVQAFGCFLTSGNSVNGELRTGKHITANENILLSGLIGQLVSHGIYSPEEFHLGVLQQVFKDDGLTDGEDDHVGIKGNQFVLVIFGIEAFFLVEHRGAFLEDDAAYLIRA